MNLPFFLTSQQLLEKDLNLPIFFDKPTIETVKRRKNVNLPFLFDKPTSETIKSHLEKGVENK